MSVETAMQELTGQLILNTSKSLEINVTITDMDTGYLDTITETELLSTAESELSNVNQSLNSIIKPLVDNILDQERIINDGPPELNKKYTIEYPPEDVIKAAGDSTKLEGVSSSPDNFREAEDTLKPPTNEITKDLVNKLNFLKISKLSSEKRIKFLEANTPEDYDVTAWCADLSEELSGEVGTAEIPGESTHIQIRPGFEGGAGYDSIRDGQLVPTFAQPPAGVFYNLAMLPGWQKWKPTFRYATIDSLDTEEDTADITIEGAKSSQQNLDVNQETSLTGVSIEYMDCNSVAFEEGDNVLVMFDGQEWSNPKIIGFKEDPQPCSSLFFIRPLFNGNIAVIGNEELKLTIPTIGPLSTKVFGTSNPPEDFELTAVQGLCGPFEVSAKELEEMEEGEPIEVRLQNNYDKEYFTASVLREYPSTIKSIPITDPSLGTHPDMLSIYHGRSGLNEVYTTKNLFASTGEEIEIEGKIYSVFEIEFSNLNKIRATFSGNPQLPRVNVRDYGLSASWQDSFDSGGRIVNSVIPAYFSVESGPHHLLSDQTDIHGDPLWWYSYHCDNSPYNSTSGYGCNSPGAMNYWYSDITTSEQYVKASTIVTDEKGRDPKFCPSTWHTNFKIDSQIVLVGETGDAYGDINLDFGEKIDGSFYAQFSYPIYRWEGSVSNCFEMIPTPEDRF